jgi:hypothetical protein
MDRVRKRREQEKATGYRASTARNNRSL